MRTQSRVKGLRDEVMRTQHRVKGLQDVANHGKGGRQTRMSIVSKLAQLEAEKERIAQERSNWQEKIALINARLAQIQDLEGRLRPLLVEGEQPADEPNGRRRRPGKITAHQEAPLEELTTIRY